MKSSLRLSFFTLGLLLVHFCAHASHIVGGEFELLYLQNYSYRLSLILYSDDINIIDPAAIDPQAEIHIWRKSDNTLIRTYVLPRLNTTKVPYTNPDCVIPELSTSKVVYQAEVTLDPETFNDPGGYYISYERCCRNGVIKNIVSPGETGQAFYLEFPAVVDENGDQFINSAPYLFPPLSDFARLGYPFYFDFSGTDADGDSLVYSLAPPLAGFSSPDPGNVLPPATPGPYPKVLWASGYGPENVIPGAPGLRINNSGLIQVTPQEEGIYVFSVLVEEYRDKKKIGEVRRDFQMLVYDFQGSDFPPNLTVQRPNSSVFTEGPLNLTDADFPGYDKEDPRCVQLKITDQDMGAGSYNERLRFRVRPVNFSGTYTGTISAQVGYVNPDEPEFFLDLCLPACPPRSGTYLFDVIAYDDACAVPLTDTLRVAVNFESQENQAPQTQTQLNDGADVTVLSELGQPIEFLVSGSDADGHNVLLQLQGDGLIPEQLGMQFQAVQGAGTQQSTFRWTPDCNNVNLDLQSLYTLNFITTEQTDCPIPLSDTLKVSINLSPAPNQAPAIRLADLSNAEVSIFAGESSQVRVLGTDRDAADLISMRLLGYEPAEIPLAFSWEDVEGNSAIDSDLVLAPDCGLLSPTDSLLEFTFQFAISDNACFNSKADTLELKVQVKDKLQDFDQVRYINVFTPNPDDDINPYFEVPNLPPDRCDNRFEEVVVFNRWGRPVFRSETRDFRWDGEGAPSGTYFYVLRYTQDEFRSPLTIIRGNNAGAN